MPRPLALPRLIFGATSLGNLLVARSEQEKSQLMRQWFQQTAPPVVIDSAGKYGAGLSLQVIGRQLARMQVAADDVLISNKLGWRRVALTAAEPTFEPGVWVDIQHDAVQDISRDGIRRCWEQGNRLLGNYRAGLLSVHDPDEYLAAASDRDDHRRRLDDIVAAYGALVDLRDQGEAIGVGVGAKDWQSIRLISQHCDLDWVMFANSLTIMQHPPELLEFMEQLALRGVTIVNSALMHGGFLSGGDFCDYRRVDPESAADAAKLRWRARYHAACRELDVDPYRLAVSFGLAHPAISSVALSTSRAERVADLVAAVEQIYPAAVWQRLKSLGLIAADFPV